ncbi:hypothetical protein GZ77_24695 [Endozoicomonas montiporae]|uniref:Transposase n=2 Tax=Endozoicomonas montiporae TaxID=1027273 RepID=A0A081MZT8_9GAMM|nr:transposase [Endozoicomonas montiporae]AMO54597.1 IS3 family transposase [Endozoicomonas montiporae CL-33]KEQ11711.1 hypothetical protein GZ77_24695 [Endozoicomonas montiporae]
MAERKRGSYTPEFRQKAADLAMASGVRLGDIAKTLDLVPSTLSNWVARRKQELGKGSVKKEATEQQKAEQLPLEKEKPLVNSSTEIEKLKLEIKRLQQERKVVKEAIRLLTS